MQLAIGCPRNGWLPVVLSIAGESDEFRASAVLNDPLTEFVTAALWCLDTEYQMPSDEAGLNPPHSWPEERGIHFWLEPEWHTLLLLKVKGSEDIRLRFYVNHQGGFQVDENDFRTSTRTIFGSESAIAFARVVYAAVSESLHANTQAYEDANKRHWPGFPYGLLERLGTMVGYL